MTKKEWVIGFTKIQWLARTIKISLSFLNIFVRGMGEKEKKGRGGGMGGGYARRIDHILEQEISHHRSLLCVLSK